MKLRASLLGAAVVALAAGAVVAQVETPPAERSAAPPPSEAEPPPPIAPSEPLSNVMPDEGAPPAPDSVPAEELQPAPSVAEAAPPAAAAAPAAAMANNVQEEEPPPPPPPPPPLKRPRYAVAILQALDKATSDTLRFEAKVGQPIRYKGLTLTVHACETNNPGDDPLDDSYVHLEVSSQPQTVAGRRAAPPRQVFRGWMVSSSQSLHPLEHPLYDLWVIACKTDAPPAPGSSL